MRIIKFFLIALLSCTLLNGCKTISTDSSESKDAEPPEIYANMPLEKAIAAAIDHGGKTLSKVKRLITRRNQWAMASRLTQTAMVDGKLSYKNHQLINAMHMYISAPVKASPKVFTSLVRSGRPLARQLAWHMAAVMPSKEISTTIDDELSIALENNDEEAILLPQMARAVRANKLDQAYSIVRHGLMLKGNEEFAETMIALNPKAAALDFISYLTLAPPEELRQLTLSTVNLYTCIIILRHLEKYPIPVSHDKFAHLFYYSVSRVTGLSELARGIIERYLPSNKEHLAFTMSGLPVWVQIAYLENARRQLTPKVGVLLSELKKISSQRDVIEEINEVIR